MTQVATTDNLAAYLDALEANERLQVVAPLKSSAAETTELVCDGSGQLFVRKIIARESGTGGVYAQLKTAQDAGRTTPHLPRVWMCVKTESDIIVVMEYLQGENLWQRLDREGCGVEAARRYFPELCRAVTELHTCFDPPIIHRDLKPTNVLITPEGLLALIDFGISREYRADAATDTQFLGTREYAPPEQFGFRQTDARSDVYSLGMILYHILTGQTPSAALHDEGFVDPDIPAALRPVLLRATEFDPERRFAAAEELRVAFEVALSGNVLPGRTALAKGALAKTMAKGGNDASGNPRLVAVLRDLIALSIVVFGVFMLISTWDDPGLEVDWSYRAGQLLSGFALFFPMLTVAYWISSKQVLRRLFPALAGLTRKQEILYGILFAVALFIVCLAALMIVTSVQA